MNRLPITKTPKCYVGGAFIRSESGRVQPMNDAGGEFFANIPQCSRKDLRNAVEAAAKAGPGWAKRTAYNRGQIIYRMAEMIEAVCGLTSRHLYKSMTTYRDSRIWQDVYRPVTVVGEVYLKLTVIDDVLIVSFKEL